MNEWITSIQPPGLMQLLHHQKHHLGHQVTQAILDGKALQLLRTVPKPTGAQQAKHAEVAPLSDAPCVNA